LHETSKAVQRRLHDSNFATRYFKGHGIDIGSGDDPLGAYVELFPLMSCESFDKGHGDAQTMESYADETFDFVHSSHCLEDLADPIAALENWWRIVRPGGHLIVTVPDEDMYEQGVFPSTFNPDHKWTFAIWKAQAQCLYSQSLNIIDLISHLLDAEVIKLERLTGTFRAGLERQDQTHSIGECAIEFILRKPMKKVPTPELRNEPQAIIPGKIAYAKRIMPPEADEKPIALHRPGAIGDIIMTLSLIPLLRIRYPNRKIHYFCHNDIGLKLQRLMKEAGIEAGIPYEKLEERKDRYHKVINLVGYPLDEGYPEKPMARHLIEYFADEMGMTIPSIPFLPIKQPPVPPTVEPLYATIHPQAGWSIYKTWAWDRWEKVIESYPKITFYQIGAKNDVQLRNADHSFMGGDFNASIDLIANAKFHLGVDTWSNHLTNVFWLDRGFVPAVILWGSTQWTAAGYERNQNISLGLDCQPCFREDPKISRMPRGPCINPPGQVYEQPRHACMEGISVEHVIEAIQRL
jgi:ADP-heptose:LPS heptosyltransferase